MKTLAIPFKPPRGSGRILDVGSGNNPLDIATHLVDFYPENDHERGGTLDIPFGKQFKEGNIEAIPFPDGFFDFVHASHVLEHAQDPEKALSELSRVARCGYIETPAAAIEQGTRLPGEAEPGWSFHRWMAWGFPEHPVIYIRPKTPAALKITCLCAAAAAYRKLTAAINLAELDRHLPYYCKMTQFLWTGTPEFEIWREDQQGNIDRRLQRCNCAYSAFFAWGERYFSSLTQLRRRWVFRKAFPAAFQVYKAAAKS